MTLILGVWRYTQLLTEINIVCFINFLFCSRAAGAFEVLSELYAVHFRIVLLCPVFRDLFYIPSCTVQRHLLGLWTRARCWGVGDMVDRPSALGHVAAQFVGAETGGGHE